MLSEKVELLGKSVYGKDIPKELTLKSMSTSSELDYVGSEDFEQLMLDTILPKCVEEQINFHKLLEIDFSWVCRCLRLLNYGPYFTTNGLFCSECGEIQGNMQVDLRSVACIPLPDGFKNDIVIKRDELIDFNGDIHIHLLTIQERINAFNDKMFTDTTGKINKELARLCYMITSYGTETNVTPIQVQNFIENELSAADYIVLKELVREKTNYGLRAGGSAKCPKCGSDAAFIALVDDRFLRPTVGDIRAGKDQRHVWGIPYSAGDQEGPVRTDS